MTTGTEGSDQSAAQSRPVVHLLQGREVARDAETIIIGTFNPQIDTNEAKFFYSRPRNHLWKILPAAFAEASLKGASRERKETFIASKKIDFIDLIDELDVPPNIKDLISDTVIDRCRIKWRNVEQDLDRLHNLKRVCISRQTFNGVPNIRARMRRIESYCLSRGINFQCLLTPARSYNEQKQRVWTSFLRSD